MIRKHKVFSRPKKPFELVRMKDENILIERYGLKNKREIWRTIAKVNYFRHRAMALAKSSDEEQKVLFDKLNDLGLNVNSIADVLALNVENLLNRRLQTIVFKKGFARTSKQARQFITHRRVFVDERVMNVPGYILSVDEENKLNVLSVKQDEKSKSGEKE